MNQLFIITIIISIIYIINARPTEDERVRLWKEKNTWPPKWRHESNHKKKVMAEREAEIMTQLIGADERWENWLQQVQSRMVPTFTPS